MAYGNYAPFYRPNYYPMQNVQENGNQFGQVYQQPMQAPQIQPAQPQNDMIWVQGEAGAKAYLVAPNTSIVLWDSENPTIYVKSADSSGIPSIKILDFTERNSSVQKSSEHHECKCGDKYVSLQTFKALEQRFNSLAEEFESFNVKAKAKTSKTKEDNE